MMIDKRECDLKGRVFQVVSVLFEKWECIARCCWMDHMKIMSTYIFVLPQQHRMLHGLASNQAICTNRRFKR